MLQPQEKIYWIIADQNNKLIAWYHDEYELTNSYIEAFRFETIEAAQQCIEDIINEKQEDHTTGYYPYDDIRDDYCLPLRVVHLKMQIVPLSE